MINEAYVRFYMKMAKMAGENKISCYTRRIGAVIVDPEANRVLGIGKNGPPRGVPHNDDDEYLEKVVWPQLTRVEKEIGLAGFDEAYDPNEDERCRSTFITAACNGKICPRRLVGAESGKRLELCSCLDYYSRVQLSDGSWEKIGNLVRSKYDGYVKSYDVSSGLVIDRKVVGWHEIDKTFGSKWYRIHTKHSTKGKHGILAAKFTEDHQILTEKGWRQVKDLKRGDRVASEKQALNSLQKQLVLGSLLGDGSIVSSPGSARFIVAHSQKQLEYLHMKAFILGGILSDVSIDTRDKMLPTGDIYEGAQLYKAQSICLPELGDMRNLTYPEGRKTVSADWLRQVDSLGLAFWFLDDGSHTSKDTLYITSIGRTDEEILLLQEWLREKFGLETKVDAYNRILFNTENSHKLCSIISTYTPNSMRYKLTSRYSIGRFALPECIENGMFYSEVEKVEELAYTSSNVRTRSYCIDVEDTHNFITLNCIAHNCTHAEANAIVNSAQSLLGAWMFCWCPVPCVECTKLIINSGVKRVYCLDVNEEDYSVGSRFLLYKAKVVLLTLPVDWIMLDT